MFSQPSNPQASPSLPTLGEVPRHQANMEAEQGETIIGDFNGDGSYTHARIGGQPHHKGGTPLAAPDGSFIFSDSRRMKIKDPEVLQMFNKKRKKGGYTPAELAKQYPLEHYQQQLKRDDLDPIQRQTYESMLENNQRKLGELALHQEMMKGLPDGVPDISQPLLAENPAIAERLQQLFGQAPMAEQDAMPVFDDGGSLRKGSTIYLNGKPYKIKSRGKGFFSNEDWVTFDSGVELYDKDGERVLHDQFAVSDLEKGLRKGRLDLYDDSGMLPFGAFNVNRDFRDVDNGTSDASMSRPGHGNRYNRVSVSTRPGAKQPQSSIARGTVFTQGNKTYRVVQPDVVDTRGGRKVQVEQIQDDDHNLGSFFDTFLGDKTMTQDEVLSLIRPNTTPTAVQVQGNRSAGNRAGAMSAEGYAVTPFEFNAETDDFQAETPPEVVQDVAPKRKQPSAPKPARKTVPRPAPKSTPARTGTVFDEYAYGGPVDPPGSVPNQFNFFQDGKVIDSFEDPKTGQKRQVRIQGNKKYLLDENGQVLSEGTVTGGGNFSQYNQDHVNGFNPIVNNQAMKLDPTQSYFGEFGRQHQREDSGLWTSNDKFQMDLTGDFRRRHGNWIDQSYNGGFRQFLQDVQKPKNQAAGWFQDAYNKRYNELTGQDYFKPYQRGGGNPYMRDGLFGQVTYSAPGLDRQVSPTPDPLKPHVGFESDLGKRNLNDFFPKPPDMTPPEQKEQAQAEISPSDGFWLQDMIDIGGSFADLATLKRYMPQLQQVSTDMPSFTPLDPSRQVAAEASMYHTTADQNSLTSDGAVARANNLAAAGQMAGNVSNVLSQYENQNAQMANQNASQRAELANQGRMQNAGLRQRYLQEVTTANQQFDNSKREATDRLRQRFKNAVTNKMGTDWLMQSFPDFKVDRITGQLVYQDTGDFDPTRGNGRSAQGGAASPVDGVLETAKHIQQNYPGLSAEQAMSAAMKMFTEKNDFEQNTQRAIQRNPKQYGQYPPLNPGAGLLNLFSGQGR